MQSHWFLGTELSVAHTAGYQVTGIDRSDAMLTEARQQLPTLAFYQGDARSIRLDSKYDVVTSLFHVASYQTTNDDLTAYFQTVRSHLRSNGIFIFDFWYGPAVLSERPSVRVKRIENDHQKLTRIAEPTHWPNKNRVDVHYEITLEDRASQRIETITEIHPMRYFFLPEIDYFLVTNGFRIEAAYEWLAQTRLTDAHWSGVIVARAAC